MKAATFLCLRFYIVPAEYSLFRQNVSDETKLSLFSGLFLKNSNYKIGYSSEYAIRITNVIDNRYYGKLSKKNITEKHNITPTDVEDDVIEDWPYVNFVFDVSTKVQVVVIEKNAKVFTDILKLKKCLSDMAKKALVYSGFVVNFEPIVERLAFWRIVDNAEGIFSLRLKLESPNMFGASVEARDALKHLQNSYNNTALEAKLDNPEGKLMLPREELVSYVDYADQGGGSWSLLVGKDGKKRSFTSTQNAVSIDEELSKSDSVSGLTRVLDKFKNMLW